MERRERGVALGSWATGDLCYKLLFEAGTQGVLLASTSGVLLDANPEACAMLGYGREELLRITLRNLVDTSDPQAREIFGGRRIQPARNVGLRLLRRNGNALPVEASLVQPADGSDDNMLGIVFGRRDGVGTEEEPSGDGGRGRPTTGSHDLTDGVRQQAGLERHKEELQRGIESRTTQLEVAMREIEDSEQLLRLREERWRSLIRYASDLTVILAADGTIRYESPAVERLLGFQPEDRVGTNAFDHLHPDDVDPVRSKLAGLLENPDERASVEYRVRDTRGEWHHFEAMGVNLLDNPLVDGIVVNAREITERKRSEQALAESERRFKSTFRHATIGMGLVTVDGRWLQVNRALCEIVGYTEEGLLEKAYQDITYPDDREADLDFRRRVVSGETETYELETRYLHKDGRVVWISLSGSLVRGEDGEPLYFVCHMQDITERRRAERRLEAQYAVARVLGEATTFDEASSRILETVCETLEWDVGVLWHRDRQVNVLRCARTWHADPVDFGEFEEVTRGCVFSRGEGLPGRVWATGQHAWVADVTETAGFERTPVAAREGLHAVLAMPIVLGGELLLIAEFFSRERRQPDTLVLETMNAIGAQVGQFMERRRAQEELREAEWRYRTLIEQLPAVTYIQDADTDSLTYVSPQLEDVLGYSPEEYLAHHHELFARTIHPDDREWVLAENERTDRTGEPYAVECRRIRKDGRVVWTRDEAVLVKDAKGGRLFWQGIMRDITHRRRSEEALRQSESLYRSVIEHAAENIFLVDAESKRILEANDAFHRSLGYTVEELSEVTLYDLVAHDSKSVDDNVELIMGEGSRFLGERRYRRKDGSLADVEVNVSSVPYEGGHVMCVVAHDVSERKEAEEGLRRSLEVLLALREAGQILGSTLESDAVVARLLEIMRRVSDLTAAMISHPDEGGDMHVWRSAGLERLWPRARYAPEVEAARRAVLEGEEQRLLRLRNSRGEELTGLHLPLRGRNRILGVLEAYGSEGLADEETIELLNSLSNQAASALENALLYQDLAEREHRLQDLLGQLFRTQEEERRRVAYEVHDGLAQVATAAHQRLQTYARRYPPDSEKAERDLARIVGLVHQTVGEARRIIGNLRPTALDDFGLAAAVGQTVDGLRGEGWSVAFEENLGSARLPGGVETALFRVAQEALTNARKHAGVREARVELLREDGNVRLLVKDEGRGFDPNKLLKAGPGERVGLAGMQERIALLGGSFELWSRPGEGTAVTVKVPLRSSGEHGPSGE